MANKRFDHAPKFVVKDDAVIIQQAVGSSAPLLDVKDHTGSSLMSITSAGAMTGASLTSPALTGTPTAPTPTAGTNTTQIATTEFVISEISNIFGAAPAALNTLDELAAALNDDANFATTVTNALATKAPLTSPTFTGTASAGGFYALGTTTLNRAAATAWNAGGNVNLQIDGTTYSTIGVNSNFRVQFSGGVEIGSVSVISAGNNSYMQFGPNATWGAYLRVGSSTNISGTSVAAIISTDGNLHLDNATSKSMYLNYYQPGNTISIHGPVNTNGYGVAAGGGAVTGGNFAASGYITAGSYVSIGTAYNGPHSNGGAIVRLRSGNEGSFIWDGNFGFIVDATRVKNFTIQHPTKPDKYLVHACSEGPTSDVFYRGTGQLEKGIAVIHLPDYFEDLTEIEGRTVMITPIADETGVVANLAAYEIHNGSFVVEQIGGYVVPNQRFWWRVDAVRKNTSFPVEPLKSSVNVGGFGPYTFIDEV